MFRNLEVYRSVQPLRKSSNSVGYLAQMAMSNPIRKLKFLSVDSAHQQQELHKLQFNFEQTFKSNQIAKLQKLREQFPFLQIGVSILNKKNLKKLE